MSGLPPRLVIVMGVTGAGKTTIGSLLARRLGWTFADADDFHSAANIAKMHAGQPLTDADREPWLAALAAWIDAQLRTGRRSVLACSALKRSYRDRLAGGRPDVGIVHLDGAADLIARRIAQRPGHFMPASQLQNQLDTLQEPAPGERAIVVSVAPPPDAIVDTAIDRLGLQAEAGAAAEEARP